LGSGEVFIEGVVWRREAWEVESCIGSATYASQAATVVLMYWFVIFSGIILNSNNISYLEAA